jgi:C-terminal processing protease CtpA/Prc
MLGSLSACEKKLVQPYPENFVGVGIELTIRGEMPVVVRTIDGGPAATAGLLPEDQLLTIDRESTAGMGLADVVVKLRGEEGSQVYVTLRRQGVEIATNIVRRAMKKDGDDYTAQKMRAAK